MSAAWTAPVWGPRSVWAKEKELARQMGKKKVSIYVREKNNGCDEGMMIWMTEW